MCILSVPGLNARVCFLLEFVYLVADLEIEKGTIPSRKDNRWCTLDFSPSDQILNIAVADPGFPRGRQLPGGGR